MSCPVCKGYNSSKCPVCSEGVKTKKCPVCHGSGKTPYLAMNLDTKEIIEVTSATWLALPEDEEVAQFLSNRGKKQRFCQYEEGGFVCHFCHGEGIVPEEY